MRSVASVLCPIVGIVLLLLLAPALLAAEPAEGRISRELLLADLRYLVATIDATHPDPYTGGGGKIAFYRRLEETMRSIPAEGLTRGEFYRLLLPFFAAIKDGHTSLNPLAEGDAQGPGLPVVFAILDGRLYVKNVFAEEHRELLAARLEAVQGVPLGELVARQERLRAHENQFDNLSNLCRSLGSREGLLCLVPELGPSGSAQATFVLTDGGQRDFAFPCSATLAAEQAILLPSTVTIPATKVGEPAFGFLDEQKSTALLRLENMISYREAFEDFQAQGYRAEEWARQIYQAYTGAEPPADYAAVLAGLPAATEIFGALVQQMKAAGTQTLLVDLRRNGGGNSLLADILLYFLYGWEGWARAQEGYSIARYSALFFERNTGITLEQINEGRQRPLQLGDYDFTGEQEQGKGPAEPPREALREQFAKRVPTFAKELDEGTHAGYYQPPHVAVLTSPATYSSAFILTASLHKLGAALIGVPSGQAGNRYGDILSFTLPNSGLEGGVSYKRFVLFPNDPEGMTVLPVEAELTYERWARLSFDRNAEVLLALEYFAERDAGATPATAR